jgi:hypothetical protein
MSEEMELLRHKITFYKLVNGSITIGYIALAIWGLLKIVSMI